MDLTKIKKVYMIGIKGVGMTMLAQYLAENGIDVSGSDTNEKFMTDSSLKKSGIKVYEDFDEKNLPNDADLIIYSTAYSPLRNIEVAKSADSGVKLLTYPEALSRIFNQKYGIAVVGSHGKTTTTAWLGFVMDRAGLRPSALVGSRVPQFNGNAIVGKSDYLVVETDEYQNKLKYFNPRAVLLNNIDYDHPDFFPTAESYESVFIEFIKRIPKKGFLVANYDDSAIRKIAGVNCQCKVISYSINSLGNYIAYDIISRDGMQYFKLKMIYQSENDGSFASGNEVWAPLGDFSIQLLGTHNIYNSMAVIAACIELDVELQEIRKYLGEFQGTARRAEILGTYHGAVIIDDYAHHPTEIKSTLAGIRDKYPKNKLTVVFHPHTFTRTKALLDDFSKSFDLCDELIVLDIYGSAREQQGGVHSRDLVAKILKRNNASGRKDVPVKHIPALDECAEYLKKNADRGEVIVLMGAGDVFRVGEKLLSEKSGSVADS